MRIRRSVGVLFGAIAVVVMILSANCAKAAEGDLVLKKISWVNPTTKTDGSPLTAEDYQGSFVRVFVSVAETGPWNRTFTILNGDWVTVPYPATSYTTDQFVEGRWYSLTFVIRTDTSLPMADGNKTSSDYSVPALCPVTGGPAPVRVPMAPTGTTISSP